MNELFGKKGADILTGFKGTIYGRSTFMTGCDQLLLVPKVGADGAARDSVWFDMDRVTVERGKMLVIEAGPKPGGPGQRGPAK